MANMLDAYPIYIDGVQPEILHTLWQEETVKIIPAEPW